MKRVDVWRLACAGNDIAVKPAAGVHLTDLATAISIEALKLGNGDDGEALAFNPIDGLFYHASGLSTISGSVSSSENIRSEDAIAAWSML